MTRHAHTQQQRAIRQAAFEIGVAIYWLHRHAAQAARCVLFFGLLYAAKIFVGAP